MNQLPVVEKFVSVVISGGRILMGLFRSVNLHRNGAEKIPRLESWNVAMYLLIGFMRLFVSSHSRDLLTLRAITDFPLIPTIPRGALWTHETINNVHTEIVWPVGFGREPPLRNPELTKRRYILYLHGGGGALCTSETHRWLTHGVSVRSDAVVLVPNYRRIPEVSLIHSVDDAISIYTYLLERVPAECIAIAGDSAGGTLTILTLCKIRNLGLDFPACAALLSPWCDIRQVPIIPSPVDYLTKDVVEFMISLIEGSFAEARESLSVVNPMEVDVSGFPPLLIQLGEAELFAEQIRAFSKRCLNAKTIEYHEMVHIPHFFSFLSAEGDRALNDLGDFVKSFIHLTN
jgi:monoterpene epsilon-lactone hydrolase